MRVALFITCLTDTFFPDVGRAVVRVLRHFGCRVEFPPGQTCCGQPARNAGFENEARALARRWLRIFRGSEWIVTPSGSCAAMVHKQFPLLLAGDRVSDNEGLELVERTYEFGSFLRDVLGVVPDDLPPPAPKTLTYHFPCHMRESDGVEWAEEFVRRWWGQSYRRCERMDECCGFGGVFAVNHPPLSEAMGRQKLTCLEATAAETVVCNEAGCALHLAGLGRRMGRTPRLRHVAELLSDALGSGKEDTRR